MNPSNYICQSNQCEQVDIRYTHRTCVQVPETNPSPQTSGLHPSSPPPQILGQGFPQPLLNAQPTVVVQPWGVNPEIALQMQATIAEYQQRLRETEKKNTLKDEALRRLFSPDSKGYWVVLPSGKQTQFTEFIFLEARLLNFAEPYQMPPHIELTFSCVSEPLLICENEYFDDKKLMHRLQQHTGSKIILYSSLRHTMALIRSEVDSKLGSAHIPFVAGWEKTEKRWEFRVFPGFYTVGSHALSTQEPAQPKASSPALAHTAAKAQMTAFSAIVNPALRGLLFLWLHSSFVATLLSEWQHCIPWALHLGVPGATVECYLTKLLSLNHESGVPLSADPAEFCKEMAGCKDRLLLVCETGIGKSCLKNLDQLRVTWNTGYVHLSSEYKVPFRAFSVVLGREDSPLGECTEMIPIQMTREDVDSELCEQVLCSDGFKTEYWSALAVYTVHYISDLQKHLQHQGRSARQTADRFELSMDCGILLGALQGVASFLVEFYESLSLSLGEVIGTAWEDSLIQALVTSSCWQDPIDGLAELFARAARKLIQSKRLTLYQWGQSWTQQPLYGAVYRNSEAYAFDKAAFTTVCLEAGCEPAAVKRELSRRGLLRGKRTNAASYTTRITVHDAYGRRSYLSVYSIDRQLIDVPGEPLPELS